MEGEIEEGQRLDERRKWRDVVEEKRKKDSNECK